MVDKRENPELREAGRPEESHIHVLIVAKVRFVASVHRMIISRSDTSN